MSSQTTNAVLLDVVKERRRQIQKWGVQSHELPTWAIILGEEFGEVCQAIQCKIGISSVKDTDSGNLYEELIHLAAVAVQIAEQVKK